MPLGLEIRRILTQSSERVKSLDFHPTEPWILVSLLSGMVDILNYQEKKIIVSFKVSDLPVRSAKFIARKHWIIAGSDGHQICVYNYNTMEKIKQFDAHDDFIRSVAVHPTLPLVLTASDDTLIKLWDWENGWTCTQIFGAHTDHVMQVTFNPKDPNVFASASLDHTVKVWNINLNVPNFTLVGHLKGVACVDYFPGVDKPYLISGSDDLSVKVWDYQTKSCVQTLEGHTNYISSVCFHPELPILFSCSEDETVRIWHAITYRLENSLNYWPAQACAVSCLEGSRYVAFGYDLGTIMVEIGREEPVASMDNRGKIIWAKHNEIQAVTIRSVGTEEVADGESLMLSVKDLGTCEIYPQSLKHDQSGRFLVVCGDGEYIIYTALALRNKSFGSALEFVWSSDGEYAVRESTSKITVFKKTFQEKFNIQKQLSCERIYGGPLLGICSIDYIGFFDWTEFRPIWRIDVNVKKVYWADSGDLMAIATDSSFYILKYNRDVVASAFDDERSGDKEYGEDAFEVLYVINEHVKTGTWVGDCFIYNNSALRLNYCVGGEVTTMFHLDHPMYLLGYVAKQSRVYLIDKCFNVTRYTLPMSLIEYKTLVMRGELDRASQMLPSIPPEHHTGVARFLESRGMLEVALEVAVDLDYKFELGIQLGRLDILKEIAVKAQDASKWNQLGELAMSSGQWELLEECLLHGEDLSGLFLLYSSFGDAQGMLKLASLAKEQGKNNVAFLCLFLLGRLEDCIQLLLDSNRIPEAAHMARSYLPSKVSEIVAIWKNDLRKVNKTAADSLADPKEYPNFFEDPQVSLSPGFEMAKETSSYPSVEPDPEYTEKVGIQIDGKDEPTFNG